MHKQFKPMLALLMLGAIPGLDSVYSALAAETAMPNAGAGPGIALDRYVAGMEQTSPWNLETVEIEASMPKLKKQGRLRALRRQSATGKPQYQVLETAGDETIRRRVIIRYLSAEAQAAEIPASTIAVTPANYKFRYKGTAKSGGRIAYIFQITPYKKRDGLIRGELWLDGDTGAVLRESGRLVKSPSIFLKRVEITREVALSGGTPEARTTHVTIEARLLGTAQLTILERPIAGGDDASVPFAEEQ
jgi:hypothetical protein